ncbi:MAG: hypothetical protein ACPG4Z_01460 [Chitinophagales bacterium]
MKKFLFFLTTLFVFTAYAQETSVEIDERLYTAFSEEELTEMTTEKIAFLNYYVENGYVVQQTIQEKYDIQDLIVVEIEDLENINIFELPKFDYTNSSQVYFEYKIKDEVSFLIVYSMSKVKKEYYK